MPLCDSISMNKQIHRPRNQISGCQNEQEEEWEMSLGCGGGGGQIFFQGNENV